MNPHSPLHIFPLPLNYTGGWIKHWRRGSSALFLVMTHACGHAAIGCRPDSADAESDLLALGKSFVENNRVEHCLRYLQASVLCTGVDNNPWTLATLRCTAASLLLHSELKSTRDARFTDHHHLIGQ